MDQILLTALQTTRNERNIIVMVPFQTPEDDIISALEEVIEAARHSKELKAQAAAEHAKISDAMNPEVVS